MLLASYVDFARASVPRLSPAFGQAGFRLLAGFSAEEVHLLAGMLRRMLDNIHQPAEGPEGPPRVSSEVP